MQEYKVISEVVRVLKNVDLVKKETIKKLVAQNKKENTNLEWEDVKDSFSIQDGKWANVPESKGTLLVEGDYEPSRLYQLFVNGMIENVGETKPKAPAKTKEQVKVEEEAKEKGTKKEIKK